MSRLTCFKYSYIFIHMITDPHSYCLTWLAHTFIYVWFGIGVSFYLFLIFSSLQCINYVINRLILTSATVSTSHLGSRHNTYAHHTLSITHYASRDTHSHHPCLIQHHNHHNKHCQRHNGPRN